LGAKSLTANIIASANISCLKFIQDYFPNLNKPALLPSGVWGMGKNLGKNHEKRAGTPPERWDDLPRQRFQNSSIYWQLALFQLQS